ncbi:MAG TPA: exopolysaccharide biosynthesis polyprenyl glycosylphosphotransferase, partial [Candidatus Saccharimonadales bacterium]|nr:exopolysaccharide biosynthesis polyprenyl glycosylphosphotransferase [Candidatus Saccharimonadales bacterium]
LLGLYGSRIYEKRFSELGRLFVGSLVGMLALISFSYIANVRIFPARLVVLYAFLLAFLFLLLFRNLARGIRRELFGYGLGINNVLIVGDTKVTDQLIESLRDTNETGYRVVGVVGGVKHKLTKHESQHVFVSFDEAVHSPAARQLHTIIQTELYSSVEKNNEILTYAQEHHVAYRFVPGNSELFVGNLDVDLFNSIPVIVVHQTALVGWGRVVKRLSDIILGSLGIIIASPLMLLTIIAIKVTDPKGPVFFRVGRLTRFGNRATIIKFRTHKQAFNGLSPEEAFVKMGRPELAKLYRESGDQLPNDPRVSWVGRFLRTYSLDELPQLFNVVKGDISFVGPRALDPFELEKYAQKNLILSVKSGLTGLAQISGRRDISFEERRQLDLFYVQNWSFWNDLVIIAKTVSVVLFHRGAI